MSPVVEDKAAEWSSLHETHGWTLPREKELGVGVGTAGFLPRSLQEGSQNLFLPILPLITSTKPLPALRASISQVPSGREAAEGKLPVEEQMSCQINGGEGVQCLTASVEFFCATPWSGIRGIPWECQNPVPRVRPDPVPGAIRTPCLWDLSPHSSVTSLGLLEVSPSKL